ncbi:uncharacterized protein LOC127790939 [Diospyros lotus]|uniref:uncharacterized protein LOC127790939 n=1 Tax=Diospyros lotus TaxID=55363 RepID=UPI00225AA910|nr:uncharacterized protein LOC127790939 [Diospyros lotus]
MCQKLKELKCSFKALNRQRFSHISDRAQQAVAALKQVQLDLHDNPRNLELRSKVDKLTKESRFLSEAERQFYVQITKSTYLMNCDKGTELFHAIAKRNAKRRFIATVHKADGSLTTSQSQVEDEFMGYFKGLLGRDSLFDDIDPMVLDSCPKVSVQQAQNLIKMVSRQEIKVALDGIGEDKAPGLDGYTSCFFKKARHIIGNDFCEAVEEFFRLSSLLKQVNHSAIALIPKSSHVSTVQDYRLISCCNVTYK